MNIWIYIALVVVVVVYFLLSKVGKNKSGDKKLDKAQVEPDADYVYGTRPATDGSMWFFYAGKFLVYTFVMIGHAFKDFIKIMKGFLGWYKGKKELTPPRPAPKNYLWCPRCQKYFPKNHPCFRGDMK